jgi:hypothetical protein
MHTPLPLKQTKRLGCNSSDSVLTKRVSPWVQSPVSPIEEGGGGGGREAGGITEKRRVSYKTLTTEL